MRHPVSAYCAFMLLAMTSAVLPICAQDDPSFSAGLKPFSSYQGGNIDVVSLSNGAVNLDIPLISYPQRGGRLKLDFALRYQNRLAYTDTVCDIDGICDDVWSSTGGGITIIDKGAVSGGPACTYITRYNAYWCGPQATDGTGAAHVMGATAGSYTYESVDATAFRAVGHIDSTTKYLTIDSFTDSEGTSYTQPANCYSTYFGNTDGFYYYKTSYPLTCESSREDANGNKITFSRTAGWTDTIGRAIALPTKSTNQSDFTGCTGSRSVTYVVIWNPPGINGGTYPLKFCYFVDNSETMDGTGTPASLVPKLESVILPNGTTWTFQYTTDTDDLYQITYPTGGTVSYTFGGFATQAICTTHNTMDGVSVSVRTVNPNDGVDPAGSWSYSYTYSASVGSAPSGTTVVTDPANNDTVHGFGVSDAGHPCVYPYETQTQYYQGSHTSGSLLKTVNTNYVWSVSYAWGQYTNVYEGTILNLHPTYSTTTLSNGQQAKTVYSYDTQLGVTQPNYDANWNLNGSGHTGWTYGRVLVKYDYDYGNGAPGPLLRTTTTNYLALNNSNYLTNNLLALPSSVQVTGAGPGSTTNYNYDQYSLVSSGISTQHDANPPDGAYRGNLTSVSRWLNDSTTSTTNCPISVSNSYVVSYSVYNDTGTVDHSVDSCGSSASDANHKTTYSYSSTYAGAFPTTVTNALGQTATSAYDFNTGLTTSVTDPNSQTTSFSYDNMLRTSQITHPAQMVNGSSLNGQTTFCYTDMSSCAESGPNVSVVITEKMNATQNRISAIEVDGVGREIRRNTTNAESIPYDQVDTCYDGLGHVSYKSYPYQSTGLSATRTCSGAGDSFAYDGLGRTKTVTHADNSSVQTTYAGRATSVTDEGNGTQGVQRISQVDGLGRLASLCEISGNLTVGISGSTTASSCGLDLSGTGFLTTYAYDALDNLTSVTQSPLNGRAFTYDSLSHLTKATNPESGTACYGTLSGGACQSNGYDANGNLITKTDARGVVTTYSYDKPNRLVGKTYSDGTPSVTYNYDQTSAMGVTLTNTVGRRSSMTTGGSNPTGSVFSYDSMGRVLNNSQCTPQNCSGTPFSLTYAYDLIGDLTSSSNGLGLTLTYSTNLAGRLTALANSATPFGSAGTLLGSPNVVHYNPAGSIVSVSLGNGVNEARTYDGRLRLTGVTDGSVYTLTIPSNGYAPNGDILQATDSVNGTWTYVYDAFNRLCAANQSTTQPACVPPSGLYTYAYDRFGNRWQQNGPHASNLGFDANNHIMPGSGVTYDAAGNTTNDGTNGYTYDAEGRVGTVGSNVSYVYGAEGRRVRKTISGTSVDFLYDTAGNEIAQVSSTGTWMRGEIYAAGRHWASLNNATTYYDHEDWLGTERARSTSAGASYETCTSLAFGDWLTCAGSDASPMHFTGKERDSESGLDNFGARYYSSSMGRFTSIDPVAVSPKKIGDPQQFNMYSYARNNPIRFLDSDGEIVSLARLSPEEREELIAELQKDTGLSLQYNSKTGDLDIAGDPSDATGGSATFRNDLQAAINSKDTFNVVNDSTAWIGNYNTETHTAAINFSMLSKKNDAFSLGLTFYHEVIGHGLKGYSDPGDSPGDLIASFRGHTAFQLEQKVADELGLPVRMSYTPDYRDGKYFIRVMEPLSETRKRGYFAWRRNWEVEVPNPAGKKF